MPEESPAAWSPSPTECLSSSCMKACQNVGHVGWAAQLRMSRSPARAQATRQARTPAHGGRTGRPWPRSRKEEVVPDGPLALAVELLVQQGRSCCAAA